MNRLQAFVIVVLFWAAIYLPGLGSTELKGEEGRRILPAVTMLEGGSWLLPSVGGKPFLRKPPLINWLIAGAFQISGVRNEWSARLPSALCVLALGLTLVAVSGGSRWMSVQGSVLAALFALTQFGLLAKARFAGAEIEGVYAPLSGIAMVLWLAWWRQGRSPWRTWTVPFIFLGLACLAKGPSLHLLYFYVVVLAALWSERAWKALLHPAHFAGILIAAAIFAAWAIPFFQLPEASAASEVWKRQGVDRFTNSEFNALNYFTNLPRGLMDQLPWLLLAPALAASLWRSPKGQALKTPGADERFCRALGLAAAGCFVAVLLVPGVLPRYVLPLGIPFAICLALVLEGNPAGLGPILCRWLQVNRVLGCGILAAAVLAPLAGSVDPAAPTFLGALKSISLAGFLTALMVSGAAAGLCLWTLVRRPLSLSVHRQALSSAMLFAAASLLYAIAAVPWINHSDDLRPVARQIDDAIAPGASLVVSDPGYAPALFYLQTPNTTVENFNAVPQDAAYVLVREPAARNRERLARTGLEVVRTFSFPKARERFLLLQRADRISDAPRP